MKYLYTTYYDDNNSNYTYKDYSDYCKENNIEPSNENSQEFFDWVDFQQRIEWDDFMENIGYSDFNGFQWVIIGKLGLWNGTPKIEPIICDDLEEAIRKIIEVNFDFKLIVEHVDDHLEITQIHHDGRNHFELYPLNKKGEEAGNESDLSKGCYHRKLTDYLF